MDQPSQPDQHVLSRLQDRVLGSHRLQLGPLAPAPGKSGWIRFHLRLATDQGVVAPVLEGVYSRGGRGATPWIEVLRYAPALPAEGGGLDLRDEGLDLELFRALGDLLPAGSHLMLGCESAEHQDTYRALMRSVPPAATPLGALLFEAGFPKVKFFYLAEGGWEGQQKLWAEKPLDEGMRRDWERATARELEGFLEKSVYEPELEECLCLAGRLLEEARAARPVPAAD